MTSFPARLLLASLMVAPGFAAQAVEIAPHRALYSMTLGSTKSNSGVVGASGTMTYTWGETCDGWTVEQRYKLRMQYAESSEVEITSNYVTWESKDGLRYRFNERKMKNGELDEEVRGEAKLEGHGVGGTATFVRPKQESVELPAGVVFPTEHTLLLIERAQAGEQFLSKNVFDGATEDRAVEVSAVLGAEQAPGAGSDGGVKSPLLERPSWRVRLAFFPLDSKAEKPEYELGMRLHDNGVSREMLLDYGDFAVKAKLDEIEALPRPNC
jgi:EipB-like